MAKWDFLRGKFSKVTVDASYQQKIDQVLDSETIIGSVKVTLDSFVGHIEYKSQDDKLDFSSIFEAINKALEATIDVGGSPIKIRELTDEQLKDVYLAARDKQDALAEESKAVGLEVEAYTRLLAERMEDRGEAAKTFLDGVTLSVTIEPYPIVKDSEALLKWVKAQDMEAMLTLNYNTMASLIKERLEGKVNEPLPDGIDVFLKTKFSCRGRK